MIKLTHGSLCSGGIDGMAEGARRLGIKTVWNCEIDSFARKLLKQEYPDAKQYKDIYCDPPMKDLILSALHRNVRIFPSETRSQKGYLENGAKLFLDVSIFAKTLGRILSYLKIPIESQKEDLNLFYVDLPKSGMMLNGKCYRSRPLKFNSLEKGYMLLPSVAKSHFNGASRKRFFRSEFYKSNLPEFLRDGLTDGAYPNPELYEVLMDLPITRTELRS